MAQRFIVMKYKSILPTCMIPEPGDPMGADSYAYTSLKYTYTSLKYAGVVAEPLSDTLYPNGPRRLHAVSPGAQPTPRAVSRAETSRRTQRTTPARRRPKYA